MEMFQNFPSQKLGSKIGIDNFFPLIFVLAATFSNNKSINYITIKMYSLLENLCYFENLQFRREEDAEKAVEDLNKRWFAGRPIYAELSPVTDFREACCRQYEMG